MPSGGYSLDVPIGHVTNVAGGERGYNLSKHCRRRRDSVVFAFKAGEYLLIPHIPRKYHTVLSNLCGIHWNTKWQCPDSKH